MSLLELQDVTKIFSSRRHPFATPVETVACDKVNLSIERGETVALVGESGSGKSTLARIGLRLLEPTAGRIIFDGRDISGLHERALRPLRRQMAMVFQDPYTSLNPRQSVAQILANVRRNHHMDRSRKAMEQLMDQVGMDPEYLDRYPHEFSGGQRQRIGVARALASDPQLIMADEPVSALDVSVRAQVLNLLTRLRDERNMGLLVVAHDLAVVRTIADRVAVMYLGTLVEQAPASSLYERPQHPYTHALLSAIPLPDPHQRTRRVELVGEIGTAGRPTQGCVFRPRCWRATAVCATTWPERQLVEGHLVACHHPGPLEADARRSGDPTDPIVLEPTMPELATDEPSER